MNIYGLCFCFLLPGLVLGWAAGSTYKKSSCKRAEPRRETGAKKKLYIHDLSVDGIKKRESGEPELFAMRPSTSSRVLNYKVI